jgi:hypothetical protein
MFYKGFEKLSVFINAHETIHSKHGPQIRKQTTQGMSKIAITTWAR